jgi:hypothetical protein
MHRVLRPGCAAVIVVGTSLIRGLNIEIQSCLKEIGEQNGLEHIHTGIRWLDRDKRMMPARWNKKRNTGIVSSSLKLITLSRNNIALF